MTEDLSDNRKKRTRKLLAILGPLWVLGLLVVILATFFPTLGRNKQRVNGELCAERLEWIFQAKEAMAHELNLDPTTPFPMVVDKVSLETLKPYLGGKDVSCPAHGRHTVRPLVDSNGEIIPPVCDHERNDPDGNGISNRGEGLYIHRRSHLQDPITGEWFREPAFVFPL